MRPRRRRHTAQPLESRELPLP
ncbi:MAG: hypothetical protein LAN36_10675 [Acidobacteriia bacterium]|nr:hypothetical protein [Terriglobia bacterium]